jgi:molybdopterin molybdotransferase
MTPLLTVEEAERRILETTPDFGAVEVEIACSAGRVLRQDVEAERDLPPFDRVMMDGIAIRHDRWLAGTRAFAIETTLAAGAEPVTLASEDGCIEVMTGAVMPAGCDCVIPIERISVTDGVATLEVDYRPEAAQFVHPRGSDHRAGDPLLRAGSRLGGPEAAVAAAAGFPQVLVGRLPEIGVISVGDELVDPATPVLPHQVRRSNDYAIESAILGRRAGTVTRAFVDDDRGRMVEVIGTRLENSDVLVLSGGVSMGKYDYVPDVLEVLGIELVFHKVSQRPGRPMWFGRSRDGKPVFALPGNPVSASVCLARFVLPAVEHGMGMSSRRHLMVALGQEVRFSPDLTLFLPVRLSSRDDGTLIGEPAMPNTSGDFSSLAGTDGFVELPKGRDVYPAGYLARLWGW